MKRQRGIALMLMFALLFIAGTGALISVLSNNRTEQRRKAATLAALQEARDAVISYAVSYGDFFGDTGAGPGHLFCPDTNNNGAENLPCANNALGRLPQNLSLPSGQTFYLSRFNADADQQFWYAPANSFRRNPAGAINTSSQGTLTVDGTTRIVAILIAPGDVTGTQSRTSNAAADYLDGGNTTAPAFFTSDTVTPANFNDLLVMITDRELWSPVSARVAEKIRGALDSYHVSTGSYPINQAIYTNMVNGVFNGGLSPLPAWHASNNWLGITTYTRLTADSATIQFGGCNITYTINFAATAIARNQSLC